MILINREDVLDSYDACSYCGRAKGERRWCCDENHFETIYLLTNGDTQFESEVEFE